MFVFFLYFFSFKHISTIKWKTITWQSTRSTHSHATAHAARLTHAFWPHAVSSTQLRYAPPHLLKRDTVCTRIRVCICMFLCLRVWLCQSYVILSSYVTCLGLIIWTTTFWKELRCLKRTYARRRVTRSLKRSCHWYLNFRSTIFSHVVAWRLKSFIHYFFNNNIGTCISLYVLSWGCAVRRQIELSGWLSHWLGDYWRYTS